MFRMQRKWILVAMALAAAPSGLVGQEPPTPAPTPTPSPRAPRAARAPRAPRGRAFAFAFNDHRGRIGVIVRTDASAETDKVGAKIEGVTPGGPADKAGIKVGDIITSFNGTSLAGVKADDDDDASGPGTKLVELARKLEPDDTVQVEYRRGGDTKKATIVTEDLGSSFRMEMPEPRAMIMPSMPEMNFEFFGSP